MAHRPTLAALVALARAGATDEALRQLGLAGYDPGDSAALTLKGRLLKDLARRRQGEERMKLFGESAAAYSAAAGASPGSYPLINAASLYLLAGDSEAASLQARAVLALIEAEPDEPETPYWLAATRAEALLLLDRDSEARDAFAEAVALAPRAWEDHASTLRQFGLILEAQGKDSSWLDARRPPSSIHFGGHMSFAPQAVRREHLDEKIAAVLEEENVGFGYGALAAGADIIVAEALLARGAELNVILPGGTEAFAAVSVDPFGKAWRRRFDAALALASTVRPVRPLGAPPDRIMIGVADEIAMGAAAMNARRLESRALLLVLEEAPAAAGTEGEGGWLRRSIAAPREDVAAAERARLPVAAHRKLAVLNVALGPAAGSGGRLRQIANLLGEAPAAAVQPYFTGTRIVVGYEEIVEAGAAAVALAKAFEGAGGVSIGGHYGVSEPVPDPFSGGALRLAGEAAALAAAAAASAPPGAVCVTGDFAAALAASREPGAYAELVGELDGPAGDAVELFALKPRL